MSSVSLPPSVSVSLSLSVTLSFRCLCLLWHPVLRHVRLSSPFPVSSHHASPTPSYSLCDWEGTPDTTAQLCVGVSNWVLWGGASTTITISPLIPAPHPGPLRAHLSPRSLLGRPGWSKYRGQPARPAMCSGLQHCFPQRGFHVPDAARAGGLSQTYTSSDTQGLSTGKLFTGVREVPVL